MSKSLLFPGPEGLNVSGWLALLYTEPSSPAGVLADAHGVGIGVHCATAATIHPHLPCWNGGEPGFDLNFVYLTPSPILLTPNLHTLGSAPARSQSQRRALAVH